MKKYLSCLRKFRDVAQLPKGFLRNRQRTCANGIPSGLGVQVMFYTYILYSIKTHTFYVGQSSDVIKRLKKHNQGESKSTKFGRPWVLIHSEEYLTRSEAVKKEQYFKSSDGWRELQVIKQQFLRDVAQPG